MCCWLDVGVRKGEEARVTPRLQGQGWLQVSSWASGCPGRSSDTMVGVVLKSSVLAMS